MRATAAELLEESFIADIGKKKKMSRLNVNIITDYSRSISAPAPNLARAVSRLATSPEILDSGLDSGSVGTSNEGSILTPTDVSVDNPLQTTRRDSSGVLQSPDVLDPAKEDGFYLLKKDSQRRATLGKILKDVHDFCLTEQHLSTLVEGMKGYIEGSKNS